MPVNLAAVAAGLPDAWSPRVVRQTNEMLVKWPGSRVEFVRHQHDDTGEAGGELTAAVDQPL